MAPCRPVEATSPAAHRPGSDVRPCASVQIAAHVVMLGRRDRDRLAAPDRCPPRGRSRATLGNFSAKFRADRLRGVEEGAAPGGDFGEDAARDDVARRQFGVLVQRGHEALARAIDENRALAAQSFGRQRRRIAADVDGGRVELHEFGVGDARAGARREGQSRAVGLRRIGGEGVKRADAAGRQHDGARGEGVAARRRRRGRTRRRRGRTGRMRSSTTKFSWTRDRGRARGPRR